MAGLEVSSSENAGLAERPLSGNLDGRNGHEPALRTALFLTLPCHAILHRSRGMYINRYSRISPKITPLIANAPH